jgi:hypothetical protein
MKKIALTLIAASATLLSTGAFAQGYVSAAVGQSKVDLGCSGAETCDSTGTAFKLVGGYPLGNGWAGELGYINFGKAKAADAGDSLELKANAITLGAAYQFQFSPAFGANFRLGVGAIKTKASATLAGIGSGSESETKAKPYFGLGLNYALSKTTKLELGADFTKAEIEGEKEDVRAVTFGVRFDF